MEDSLAGRTETIELFGFSQGEIEKTVDHFVDVVFSGQSLLRWSSSVGRSDYLARACAGGYPEALRRDGRRREDWLSGYANQLLQRDAREVSTLQRLGDLPRLLELVAARSSCELNKADLANDAGFPTSTIDPYLDLLEALYLVRRIPAWSSNFTKRVVGRPKATLVDSGLVASLLNLSPEAMHPTRNPTPAGPLLEGFVANEIRRQLAWSDVRARLFHFRDRIGPEIDLVLEHRDGRVVAIDVKASTSPGRDSFRWLSYLRDRLGDRFVQGIVLYTGSDALSFGDRLAALPIEALWRRW